MYSARHCPGAIPYTVFLTFVMPLKNSQVILKLKSFVQPAFALILVLMFLAGPGLVLEAFAQDNKKWFDSGRRAFKEGDYETARLEFKRAIEGNPSNAKAHYYLGLTYNRLGKPHPAATSLEKALELDPSLPGAHLHLGISYYKEKNFDQALEKFRVAQKHSPQDGTVYFFTGLAQQGKGQYRQSIPSFQQAAKLDADFRQSSWYYIGKGHYHAKQHDLAGKAFEEAIRLDPESSTAHRTRKLWAQMKSGQDLEKKFRSKAGMGLEFNDNLTSVEQDIVSEESDTGFIFELESQYQFWEKGPYSAEVSYDFYQSLYFNLTDFNLQSHSLGLSGKREVNFWDLELDYNFSHNRFLGDGFLNVNHLSPAIGRLWSPRHYTRFNYVLEDKAFLQDANSDRDAVRNSIGFDHYMFFKKRNGFLHIGYRLIDENSEGDPFDYLGNQVTVSGKWVLAEKLGQIRLRYVFFNGDYKNITPEIGEERLDRRHTFQFVWTKKIQDHFEIKFDFQHRKSNSNLPSVDYSENAIFAGASYLY